MATKLPSGKYRTQVCIDPAKRKYKSFIGKTAREADLLAEQWKLENRGLYGAGSFRSCAEKFLSDMDGILSPSTLRSYRSMLNNLPPAFANKEISALVSDDFYPVYKAMKAPKTVRNYHGLISAVYSHKGVSMPRVTLPEKAKADMHIPNEMELKRIADLVKDTTLEIPFALGIRGMRRGEICAVRKEDIDGNILHIRRAVVYDGKGFVEKGPKTAASDRYIPLPDKIAKKIKEAGKATSYNPESLSCAFRRMLKRNGMPHYRFHDLRHAFVSIAHANNVPDAYIMTMGGWSTSYTMQNVYRHTLDDHLTKYTRKMDKVLPR